MKSMKKDITRIGVKAEAAREGVERYELAVAVVFGVARRASESAHRVAEVWFY